LGNWYEHCFQENAQELRMTDNAQQPKTLFDLIGGQPVVDRLVVAFYRRMDTLPEAAELRAMHHPDLTSTIEVLQRYLGEWLGGPTLYSQERGHPRLRMRHFKFHIGPAERDAWMLCMRGALEEAVTDEFARKQIEEPLARLADFVRNDEGNPHDANGTNGIRPA
jgi:hemoglobin